MVLAETEFVAKWIRSLGVPDERTVVIRQGIDYGEFQRPDDPVRVTDSALRVLYLGQIAHHKGVDLIVSAVSRLQREGISCRLRMFGPQSGDRGYLQRLTPMIDGSGIRLDAPVPRNQLARVLSQTDVLVVASRWYEAGPSVIREAFAANIPVVAADHGSMAEQIRNGENGLLFEPGSVDSLTACLRLLCEEPRLLTRLRAGIEAPYNFADEMRVEDQVLAGIIGARHQS
jgi:glycosyltransferase involved in cell wall biosynthesis